MEEDGEIKSVMFSHLVPLADFGLLNDCLLVIPVSSTMILEAIEILAKTPALVFT